MYTYSQGFHAMWKDGVLLNTSGHAGNGKGRDNPEAQGERDTGPLPRGPYKIGPWHDHEQLGPCVAALTPLPDKNGSFAWLQGRSGFFIHGPDLSEGCIVQQHDDRMAMSKSGDFDLTVIE